MPSSIQYASFLIRLRRETGAEADHLTTDWHCEVEHIQSGLRWTFDTVAQLLDFLRHRVEDPDIMCSTTDGQTSSPVA